MLEWFVGSLCQFRFNNLEVTQHDACNLIETTKATSSRNTIDDSLLFFILRIISFSYMFTEKSQRVTCMRTEAVVVNYHHIKSLHNPSPWIHIRTEQVSISDGMMCSLFVGTERFLHNLVYGILFFFDIMWANLRLARNDLVEEIMSAVYAWKQNLCFISKKQISSVFIEATSDFSTKSERREHRV